MYYIIIIMEQIGITVEPLCSGHLWGMKIWPLKRGGPNLGVLIQL